MSVSFGAKTRQTPPMQQERKRLLTLTRGNHFIGCAIALGIVIDGLECAEIASGQQVRLSISTNAHEIFVRQRGPFNSPIKKFSIPAGTDDLLCEIKPIPFKGGWDLILRKNGMDAAAFSRQAEKVLEDLFNNGEMQRYLLNPNNRRRDLTVAFEPSGLIIRFEAAKSQGFGQWSTGQERICLPYMQFGLAAPENASADFYRQLTQRAVQNVLRQGVWKVNQYGALYM